MDPVEAGMLWFYRTLDAQIVEYEMLDPAQLAIWITLTKVVYND